MTNTLGAFNPIFYANELLLHTRKALGMGATVHTGFDMERKKFSKGQTISIKKPAVFVAQNAPSAPQDVDTQFTDMTLNIYKEVKFTVTDQERAYTGRQVIDAHIEPAAYALADAVDQALSALYADIPWVENIAGSTFAVADIAKAQERMFENRVPMKNEAMLHAMVGGSEQNALVQLQAFAQWQGAGPAGVAMQDSGQLMRKYGFGFFANQNRPTHTAGTNDDLSGTIVGAHAKGVTAIAVTALGLTKTIKKGDTLVIAGNTQRYAVTADVTTNGSGAATIAITPALAAALSGSEVVTTEHEATKTKQALFYHRNAFALAFADLDDYAALDPERTFGVNAFTARDPVTGLSVRARMYAMPNESEVRVALDFLAGAKTLDPNLAVRMRS